MFCPECGSRIGDDQKFCMKCGFDAASFRTEAGIAQQTNAQEPKQVQTHDEVAEGADAVKPQTPDAVTAAAEADDFIVDGAGARDSTAPGSEVAAPLDEVQPQATSSRKRQTLKTALIGGIGALVAVVVVALVVVFALPHEVKPGEVSTGIPVVKDRSGAEVKALERPTFISVAYVQQIQQQAEQALAQRSGGSSAGGQSSTSGGAVKGLSATATPLAEAKVPSVEPSADLGNVENIDEMYLNDEAKEVLAKNGFVVSAGSGGDEFYEEYEQNRYSYTPNFVTVDSMMHTYHLYFSHLLKTTEKGHLAASLTKVSKAMLAASAEQANALAGTEWEEAALRNIAFFAVGASLLDEDTKVPESVSAVVSSELDKIQTASGTATSSITGGYEDYSQYIVRGYYEGDPVLESYFKAMMWYGRINFTQKNESLDRSALLMTLAMHGDSLEDWESIYAVTSFFAGASDDCGYYEYYPLIEAAYGEGPGVDKLAGNEDAWKHFHELTAAMPAPKINSVPTQGEDEGKNVTEEEKGYRFMGQRFTIDASIFQDLIYERVQKDSGGNARMLPDALDVPAALGSDEALSILNDEGNASYEGYSQRMDELRTALAQAPASTWSASLYSQWLYTLTPLLTEKGEGYPQFMQSSEWNRKSLQTYLGSYTELKHDTVLLAKQAIAEMGGGEVEAKDDRGYVEPEPELFRRLGSLTNATAEGLKSYGFLTTDDENNLGILKELADKLAVISDKELQDEELTDDEYELIRGYGGQLEHFWQEANKGDAEAQGLPLTARFFPAAVVTDVATDNMGGRVLELGTGKVSSIYVLVPIDGKLRVATGTVYSFYQFEQPMSERLTDSKWRQMIGIDPGDSGTYGESGVETPDWTRSFQIETSYD